MSNKFTRTAGSSLHQGREERGVKSSMSLSQLKKTTQNFPLLQSHIANSQRNVRKTLSRGKLRVGSTSKPIIVLSKQQRKNPFIKEGGITVSEQIINKKGLFELASMGVLNKQVDCYTLLNLKYQPQVKPQEPATFLTNPAILINAYYQNTRNNSIESTDPQKSLQTEKIEESVAKVKKIRSSKKKVVKTKEDWIFVPEPVKLTFSSGRFENNQIYRQYMKDLRKNGQEILFKIYSEKIKQFAQKYNIKKFTIIPQLNQTQRLTQRHILESIPNARLIGLTRKIKGSALDIFKYLILMKIQKIRFRKLKLAVSRMEKVKSKFKIKQFYREMLNRRWQYLNFKLGAFAQSQRRAIEQTKEHFDVEIHVIASDKNQYELNSYYKAGERGMANLMRLYSNQTDHVILLHQKGVDLGRWVESVENMPSGWKKPTLHVIQAGLGVKEVQQCADIYFGLTPADISRIKSICSKKKAVLIPNHISKYLPYLCECLGVELFSGSFSKESLDILEEDELANSEAKGENEKEDDISVKFKKLQINSFEMTNFYRQRVGKINMANYIYQDKYKFKLFLIELGLPTPITISLAEMNLRDFYTQFVKAILKAKQYNKWILKLPNSTFSRGLALLQTDSLKIIKDNKKKAAVSAEDIEKISKLMQFILVQKVSIPHNSLISGQQYINLFKKSQAYIQAFSDNSVSVCVFGRIQFNGRWTILGSYRRFYAQLICFGALFPGVVITQTLKNQIQVLCTSLYAQNIFGYITIQLLWQPKTNKFMFIDLVPHLEPLSSLYFYYKRLLDINQIDFSTSLSRKLFYIPFIDNNGNKSQSFQEFQQWMLAKKIKFDSEQKLGTKLFALTQNSADAISVLTVGKDEATVMKEALEVLTTTVELGGQFNKFDKKTRNKNSDGLYILDIIWKLRQVKKEMQ